MSRSETCRVGGAVRVLLLAGCAAVMLSCSLLLDTDALKEGLPDVKPDAAADGVTPDQPSPDTRAPDGSAPDKKLGEQKVPDQKLGEQKVPDQKVLDQKLLDQQPPDQKVLDQKAVDSAPQTVDQKVVDKGSGG